jgi:hypothetical protein
MTRRAHRRGGIDWLGPDKAKIRTRTAPDPLTGKRRQVSRIVYGTPDEVEIAMLQLRLLHSYGPIAQTDFTVDQMIKVHLLARSVVVVEVNGYTIEPGANLSGANLKEANLTWANLMGADLEEADLSGANLGG